MGGLVSQQAAMHPDTRYGDHGHYTLVPSLELRHFEVRYRRPSIEYITAVDDGLQNEASQLRQQASSIFLLVRVKPSSSEEVSNTSW